MLAVPLDSANKAVTGQTVPLRRLKITNQPTLLNNNRARQGGPLQPPGYAVAHAVAAARERDAESAPDRTGVGIRNHDRASSFGIRQASPPHGGTHMHPNVG